MGPGIVNVGAGVGVPEAAEWEVGTRESYAKVFTLPYKKLGATKLSFILIIQTLLLKLPCTFLEIIHNPIRAF